MVWDDVYFHNVTELEADASARGMHVQRFSKAVRHALSERGRWIAEEASGCEIRFVTGAPTVRVTLCIPETDGDVYVFKGGLFHSAHKLQAGVVRTLQLEDARRMYEIPRHLLMRSGFAPEVWRICLGRYTAVWYPLQTFGDPVRPPLPEEMPAMKWLAYGSSITHGIKNQPMTYVQQASRRLGADVMNCGLSGACRCEREMADFLATRQDWDIATLELGINMLDVFTPEQFRQRTTYLLDKLLERHPEKPVFVITIYPFAATYANDETTVKEHAFNDILREHIQRLNHPRLHLIEGSDVLDDFSGLGIDLVHPGEYGHTRMGENLAARISEALQRDRDQEA